MKIDEVFNVPADRDDWQSQVDVAKLWDITRQNPAKRDDLAHYRLAGEIDKSYDQLGQLQKDLWKSMLGKHLWRILKAQRNQPGAKNLQRELEQLNRRIGVNEAISREDLTDAITSHMMRSGLAGQLLKAHGLDRVIDAISQVTADHAGAEELGSSDMSAMIRQVQDHLGHMHEDAKDDPHAANTQVANANPAQAPQTGNPAQAGTPPTAGATVPTVGKPGDPAKAAASNVQRIAANATGQTAAAQQAMSAAKETVPVLPSDRTKAQQAQLDAAKAKMLGLGMDNALGESMSENDAPAVGDYVIMELANGRAIHAPIAELRGNSMVLALDETALQWLEEAPDHEHLKIQGTGKVSPVAMTWNGMIDDLQHDTPEGWAEMFKARSQDAESARKWGRLWRQQHVNLGDDLSLDDQRAWEDAVMALMSDDLQEQEHVLRKTLDTKDRVLTKIYFDAHRKGIPLKRYAQDLATKAGMPVDHYWNKIKPLVNEGELDEADAHVMLWPIIERVLGRKLYKGKNAADIYSVHTPDGIEIHGAVTRNLRGNEELELEQALHAAGIPIEKVKLEPDMISISLRGEMDEDTSDPYSPQTKYYIVRKGAGLNTIPGMSGSHTMAAARKQLAKLPDHQDYEIRAINTTKIPKQEPQTELDEGMLDTLKVLALLGLGAYGINATLDSMNAPSKTPLGQALTAAAQHGDKSAAKYLANLDAYIEANDVNTLSMLKDSYLDGPKAAVKEGMLDEAMPKFQSIKHGNWMISVSDEPVVSPQTGMAPKYIARAVNTKDRKKAPIIAYAMTQHGAIDAVQDQMFDLSRASTDPNDYKSFAVDFNIDFTRQYMDPRQGNYFKLELGPGGEPQLVMASKEYFKAFGSEMEELGFRMIRNRNWGADSNTYGFGIGPNKVKQLGLIPNMRYALEYVHDDADGNKVFSLIARSRFTGANKMRLHEPGFTLGATPKDPSMVPPAVTTPTIGMSEAKYHGREVKLGKPMRTNTSSGGKFKVYVRDPKTGNIKMVRFGDTTGLSIKRDDPKRRKSFRARHHCDNPGPRTKARYWSCRMWTRKPVGKILKGK
jgi:hypothetical protein